MRYTVEVSDYTLVQGKPVKLIRWFKYFTPTDQRNLHYIRHREDGPAYERGDGYKAWYVDDLRHREDGPALIDEKGNKEWWIRGNQLTEQTFNSRNNPCTNIINVEINGKKYQLTAL
jgi:hypothetical protein